MWSRPADGRHASPCAGGGAIGNSVPQLRCTRDGRAHLWPTRLESDRDKALDGWFLLDEDYDEMTAIAKAAPISN
jgi:hypothetical protein